MNNLPVNLEKVDNTTFIPEHVTTALFGCFEQHVHRSYADFMAEEPFKLTADQYLAVNYPGAILDLSSKRKAEVVAAEKFQLYNAIKLLVDRGFRRIVLAPHTCCVADAKRNFPVPRDDFQFQLAKAHNNTSYFNEVVKGLGGHIQIIPAVMRVNGVNIDPYCKYKKPEIPGYPETAI